MNKIKIGITGQSGFVGKHLSNNIRFINSNYSLVDFEDSWFENTKRLDSFVQECDIIIHLSGVNRNESETWIIKK